MIYIIIPVFNRKQFTRACLVSLNKQTFNSYSIIVVDHGSTDGTAEMIADNFPGVMVLSGNDSLWWAGAINLGVKKVLSLPSSDDELILTLNNDLVVNPDYLSQLMNVYRSNKLCLVGSVSVYYNDPEKIQFAGISWHPVMAKFKANAISNRNYSELALNVDDVESDLLSGRGTLIPVEVFRNFGMYDAERFPHYAADEDFSLMCKRNGYRLLVAVKAVVYSHVSDTGLNFTHSRLTLKQFLKTLTSIKSANNLGIRFRWAKKNSKVPFIYFLVDVIRIFGSYARSVMSNNPIYNKDK